LFSVDQRTTGEKNHSCYCKCNVQVLFVVSPKIIEMKNILLAVLLLLFISLSSCHKDAITMGVLIRIENTTSKNFAEVL